MGQRLDVQRNVRDRTIKTVDITELEGKKTSPLK